MDGKAVRLQPTQSKLIFLPLSRAQTGADARPASYTVCTTGGGALLIGKGAKTWS